MRLFVCLIILSLCSWSPINGDFGQTTIPQPTGPTASLTRTSFGPPTLEIHDTVFVPPDPVFFSANSPSQGPSPISTSKLLQPPSLVTPEVSAQEESASASTGPTATKHPNSELVLAPGPPPEFEKAPILLPPEQPDPNLSQGNVLVSDPAEDTPTQDSADAVLIHKPTTRSVVGTLDEDFSPVEHHLAVEVESRKSAEVVTDSPETGNEAGVNEVDSNKLTTDNVTSSAENGWNVQGEIYEMEATTVAPYYYHAQALNPVYSDNGKVWMGLPRRFCGGEISCSGRCGQIVKPKKEWAQLSLNECRCDQECWVFGDCCQDYFDMCAGMLYEDTLVSFLKKFGPEKMKSKQEAPLTPYLYRHYGGCETIEYFYDGVPNVGTFWVVNSCPEDYDDEFGGRVKDQCRGLPESRLLSFPVSYRLDESLVFKNIYCAICHGFDLADITFWPVQVYCSSVNPKLSDIRTLEDVEVIIGYSSPCSDETRPLMPSSAMPRNCYDAGYSPRLRCSDQFNITEPYLIGPAYENVELLCKSYFSPIEINDINFANPHCAVCGHITVEEYPDFLFCTRSASLFARAATLTLLASVTFFDGHWILSNSRWVEPEFQLSTHVLESQPCPGVKVEDSRNALLRMCSNPPPCPSSVVFYTGPVDRTDGDLRCSLEKYLYNASTGRNLNTKQRHGYYPLLIEFSFESTSEPLTTTLSNVGKYFQQMLETQCNCFVEPKLNAVSGTTEVLKLSVEVGENYKTTFRLVEYFKNLLHNSYNSHNIRAVVANFERENEICGPHSLLKYENVPLMQYAKKLFVAIPSSSCYVELEEIAFRLRLEDGTLPLTVEEIFVCGIPDLLEFCQVTGLWLPSEIQRPISGGQDIQAGPEEEPKDELLLLQSKDRIASNDSSNLPLSDKKIFNTICYSMSLTGSFALIVSCLGVHRVKKSGYLVLSLSKLSLLVLVILHLVAQHCSNASDLLMGMLSHFCWFFQAFLVLMGVFFTDESRPEETKASSRSACGYKHFNAMLITGIALSIALVTTCAVLEDAEKDGTKVGYSYSPERVFWMTDEKACYISIVGTVSLCLACTFVLYLVRMRRQKSSKESPALPKPKQTSWWPGSWAVNAFAFFLLTLWAVCDYADPTRQFWYLLFSMSCCGVGILDVVTAVVLLRTSRCRTEVKKPASDVDQCH